MINPRKIVINPDEPKAGQTGFEFYDDVHPNNGKPEEIERVRKSLKGLRGETVTVTVRGERITQTGKRREWTARRTVTVNRYADVFGTGGAYYSALKSQMKRDSDSKLVATSITISPASGEDDEE